MTHPCNLRSLRPDSAHPVPELHCDPPPLPLHGSPAQRSSSCSASSASTSTPPSTPPSTPGVAQRRAIAVLSSLHPAAHTAPAAVLRHRPAHD
eukprot:1819739-Rhodomonas_salina.1